jgi:hypothetical protein
VVLRKLRFGSPRKAETLVDFGATEGAEADPLTLEGQLPTPEVAYGAADHLALEDGMGVLAVAAQEARANWLSAKAPPAAADAPPATDEGPPAVDEPAPSATQRQKRERDTDAVEEDADGIPLTDKTGRPYSEYEIARMRSIQENQETLRGLGL